ncbi:transposase [Ahniella affigens]|uniref:Transposase n=1 Tax=Ahniella affigens TaxID=2021234 RepID=A0A2P1PRU3_9GAMM|nr:transposase [Ahniella affigens]AVP97561.1 transposase [Ahniella affigens]
MALPRDRTVPPNTNGYYHCISRCVRRAWLCGYDKVKDIDYGYRRKWVEERILLLAEAFAVSIYAYAVMSNHLHVVLKVDATAAKEWSDEEVARRWCVVFPSSEDEDATKRRIAHIAASPEMVAKYRSRLSNLSWYMRCLNEPIARRANLEDDCTGRFWEGRFKAVALLDERAFLAAMVYADLNPIRAQMTTSPKKSDHTGIQKRIRKLTGNQLLAKKSLEPIAGVKQEGLHLRNTDYVALVDFTGRQWHHGKRGQIPRATRSVLLDMKIDPEQWQEQVKSFGTRQITAMGTLAALIEMAVNTGRAWIAGMGLARILERPAGVF